jgi:hypothetical protein
MAPAFSSTGQAGAFALLLIILLFLPVMAGKSGLPPRESIYTSTPPRIGGYSYLHQQIFEEKEDIDLLFIGSSKEYLGIDTPYVQKKLSEKLGRPAIVRTLGWYWIGFDALYFITQDLLRHRKVHMLVFTDETGKNGPHEHAERWFRFGENKNDLAGLPPSIQAAYYLESILGMPRNLLGLIQPNLPVSPSFEKSFWKTSLTDDPAQRLGSLAVRSELGSLDPYVDYQPQTQATAADARVYSPATQNAFQFTRNSMPEVQFYFARKFAALARENGVKLVFLTFPDKEEKLSDQIPETQFWPGLLQADVSLVGIPSAILFGGLSEKEISQLYFSRGHFNRNGQLYFTPLITPALIDLYDDTLNH